MLRKANVFGSDDDSSEDGEKSLMRPSKKPKSVPRKILENTVSNDNRSTIASDEPSSSPGAAEEIDRHNLEKSPHDNHNEQSDYMTYKVPENEEPSRPKASGTSEDALTTPLYERKAPSIGLAMMQKMGFKIGDTLGAPKEGLGSQVPLELIVKNDRQGIGSGSKLTSAKTKEYMARNSNKNKESKLNNTISRLMKLCFQLSGESDKWYEDYQTQKVTYLWRDVPIQLENSKAASLSKRRLYQDRKKESPVLGENTQLQDFDAEDKLTLLLLYLREAHFYCYFCGNKYQNAEELEGLCPGIYEESHNPS